MRSSLVIMALVSVAGACVVPPLRIGAGGGGAGGGIVTADRQGHAYEHSAALLGELRAAVTPLTPTEDRPRAWDVGVGCAFDYVDARDGAQRHDQLVVPYVEGAWFAHRALDGSQAWRVGPTLVAELPIPIAGAADRDSVGYGLGGGVLAELVEHMDGPMLGGRVSGEWGIGVAVRGGMRHVEDETYGYVLLTVEARLPFIAALPIPAPDKHRGLND